MHIKFTRFLASIAVCWLLCGQQIIAQGSFIFHTKLTNPNPDIFFGPDGVPVYNGGAGGQHSVVSIDLNHDGTEDYRVVATGTLTWGFQMEGSSLNAVWSHPTGGFDIGASIVPLSFGTGIGPMLPASDQWVTTEQTPFGVNGPGFSSYSSAGVIGLFVNRTAFAGLQFNVGLDVYYGWIKVQEIPALAGGGIVYEYAYETRPNTPILAGAGIDSDDDGVWDLEDQCPNTPAGEVVNEGGCSINQLAPCVGPWKNHGEYVAHVVATVAQFQRQRLITKAEAREIVQEAARSGCGKQRAPRPPHHGRIDREH